MMKHLRLAVPVLLLASACASSAASGGAGATTQRGDPNIIRRTELSAAQLDEMNAYQVVQQVRPRMLASQPPTLGPTAVTGTSQVLVVYLDAAKLGAIDTMKEIRMSELQEIRYLSPSEATLRYGTGHESGVILLRRRR
jgi:hypothetical protein